MDPSAAAVFAQVIPVLLIAAFLGGIRLPTPAPVYLLAYFFYINVGVAAECLCLYFVFQAQPMPSGWAIAVYVVSVYLALMVLVAGMIHVLTQALEHERRHRKRQYRHDDGDE